MKTFLRIWLALVLCCAASAARQAIAATPGGTSFSNTATATYQDNNSTTIAVQSNTVVITVADVSATSVSPNETGCSTKNDPVVVGQPFVRTFTVTNGSNVPDADTISASASAGQVTALALLSGGTSTPIQNGAALANPLQPGASVQIAVTVNPGQTPVGTDVETSLTAKSGIADAVNGEASATAQQCAIIAGGALFSGPSGAGTQVMKTVNGSNFTQAQPGSTVTYTIAFSNTGGVPATNIVVTDVVPQNITPNAASVEINGAPPPAGTVSLSGQTLAVKIASLAPGVPMSLSFTAIVTTGAVSGQSTINIANISADNAPAVATSAASAFFGIGNVVFDGLAGQQQTVGGAVVSLVDAKTNQAVPLAGSPFMPNGSNANPFQTGSGGAYGFGLSQNQIGVDGYTLTVTAPGYLNRTIGVTVTPGPGGTYSVTLTAEDGQLLASAGGFALTAGPVTLQNIYGLLGNIPLFRAQAISMVKTVDRTFASSGDRLVYTLTFANVGSALGVTTVTDTLPAGLFYAPGSGRVDNVKQDPAISGRMLTWTLPSLAAQHVITLATVILPGIADNSLLTNLATVTASAPNDPALQLSASSTVDTRVLPGVFSDSSIITGRVFYDARRTGYFAPGDRGIKSVRVYLEDGESVVTDHDGRYTFPGVRPGMHVLKIDKTTLPPDAHPYADASYDGERSIRRLVHGVFDGGLIQDINFALEGSPTL